MYIVLKHWVPGDGNEGECEPFIFVYSTRDFAVEAIIEDVIDSCADVEDLSTEEATAKINWTSPLIAECDYVEARYELHEVSMKE